MEEMPFKLLRQFLTNLSSGQVPQEIQPELIQRLEDCWDMFNGSDQEGMGVYKIQRMEDPWWDPPILSFTIERHGATMLGSSRAEIQEWTMDVDHRVAEYRSAGYRQLYQRRAPLDVKPIAEEIAQLIIKGKQDERLQWSGNDRLRISTDIILEATLIPKQTLQARRKHLLKALEESLSPYGWERRHSWWVKTS
jgi:hypothetical protein